MIGLIVGGGGGVVLFLALMKVSFQAGRIERGVKGLYERMEVSDRWRTAHDARLIGRGRR